MNENEKRLNDFVDSYWNYFLELESEFASTQKYVAFDMCNKDTYSIEFLKLFQAVCSELDVLGKEILYHFEPDFQTGGMVTIKHWGYGITTYMRDCLSTSVLFNGKIKMTPWAKFGYEQYISKKNATCYRKEPGKEMPTWWNDYNSVKHARTTIAEDGRVNYQRANFSNLVQAFAALYILEVFYASVLEEKANTYGVTLNSELFSMCFDNKETEAETEAIMAGVM